MEKELVDILSALITPREKDWVDYFTAFLTPVVAGVGIYFGFAQLKIRRTQAEINKYRLKHELFDRRYEIYEAAKELINIALNTAELEYAHINPVALKTRGAIFIFGDDIVKYVDRLHKDAIQLIVLNRKMKSGKAINNNDLMVSAKASTLFQSLKE